MLVNVFDFKFFDNIYKEGISLSKNNARIKKRTGIKIM